LRKIKTERAHKAKALDLALGLQGVNSGAKGFLQSALQSKILRSTSLRGAAEARTISLPCDEAISFLVNAKSA